MPKPFAAGDSLPAISKDIDQERIDRWAALSGDFNRLHVDPAYAGQTRFGGTIAHGPMSLAFLNELMMACFGPSWAGGGRLAEVRFLAPIRPGDRISIGGSVETAQQPGASGATQCRLWIKKQGEDKPAVTGLAELAPEGARP